MIREIVLATNNAHKVEEIRPHFAALNIKLLSLKDIDLKIEIDEFGNSFRQNSLLKAQAIRAHSNKAVLADDSGLVLPALRGEPGIYSARYSGVNATDASNRKKLLEELKKEKLSKAKAYFVCVMTFLSDTDCFQSEGKCYGHIASLEKGKNGFGYDPIFVHEKLQKHMAELDAETKNKLSHRAIALEKLLEKIKKVNAND